MSAFLPFSTRILINSVDIYPINGVQRFLLIFGTTLFVFFFVRFLSA